MAVPLLQESGTQQPGKYPASFLRFVGVPLEDPATATTRIQWPALRPTERFEFATCAECEPVGVFESTLERLTGIRPGIGISPKSARAALISETVTLEKVQM